VVWIAPVLCVVFPVAALGQIIERKIAAAMQRRHGPNAVGFEGVVRLVVRLGFFFLPRASQDRLCAGLCALPGIRQALALTRRLASASSPPTG